MNHSVSTVKKVLFTTVFTVLFLPILQLNLHLFIVKDLEGAFEKSNNIELTNELWFSTEFQEKKEKFLNENFGFRNTCIRLMNQINFVLFKKTSSIETVIGENNYLFAKTYIESLSGDNYIGNDAVLKKVFLVKSLQEKLKKSGKIFLPVIAPNKAMFYEEYLPSEVLNHKYTNYEAFKYCFDKLNIKYIDFQSFFMTIKNTTKYPLFTKYGIHWSSYGHSLATDSIINYLNVNCNLITNKLIYKNNIVVSDSLMDLDYDIAKSMNLFVDQLKSEPAAYPNYSYTKTTNNKPPLLVIGDSFNFGLQKTEMQNEVFSDYKLLYYFKELIPYSSDREAFKKLNIKDEIDNHQVIMMLFTEQNFVNYGCGFIEKALNIIDGKDNGGFDEKENKILEMVKNIHNNKEWLDKIKKESNDKNKNLDSLIRENAIYMVNILEEERNKKRADEINGMIKFIKKDPSWMKTIESKAKELNLPVDSVILKDAIYQVDIHEK